MNEQRAAASLLRWRHNFAAFGGQDSGGGGVDVRKKCALDAAEEQADAFALFALGGGYGCDRLDWRSGGEQGVHGGDGFWQCFEDTQRSQRGLHSAFLVGEQWPAQEFHAGWFREGFEEEAAMQFLRRGALVVALDLRASGFDQFPVVDAGGAGGHAGDAAETGIEMADPAFVHLRFAFESQLHQIDAAAG